jgi:hypothetical protein
MDVNILTALIGIVSGTFGYWFSTFSVRPILRYLEIRSQIHRDFIYFAQVVNAEGLNEEMQELYRERVLANRISSASLSAAFLELPYWYKNYLSNKGLAPEVAAKHLIGFSNTTDYDKSHDIQKAIREKLGLPPES